MKEAIEQSQNITDSPLGKIATVENPSLMVPQRFASDGEIIFVANLRSIPQPLDAITQTESDKYAVVTIDELQLLLEELLLSDQSAQTSTTEPPLEETKSGILLVSSFDSDDLADFQRKTDRQVQRFAQFSRITEMIDAQRRASEASLETSEHISVSILQKLALSLYADELSQEGLTKKLVSDLHESRLPKSDKALADVDALLKRSSIYYDKVLARAQQILHLTPSQPTETPEKTKGRQPLVSYPDETAVPDEEKLQRLKEEEEKIKEHEKKTAEKNAQDEERNQTTFEQDYQITAETLRKIRYSGDIYVHDPVLDEPSEEAASFVRDLFNKPY